jgi:Ca2+-transporting ATPase
MTSDTKVQHVLKHKGLTAAEVEASRRQHGANVLTPPERDPWWKLFLEKFEDPVIRILMIAAVLAIVVGVFEGKYYEGVGIIAAILLATTIAFYNEFKAGKEFELLNRTSDQKPIKVLRDDHWTEVERKDLVVGDVFKLEQGYELPADGKVLESASFQVNEAVLTGESKPVTKGPVGSASPPWEPPPEREIPEYVVCRGTNVMEGSATIQIEKVGDGTWWGLLGRRISEDVHVETPLDQQLKKLSKWIGVVGFLVAALTFCALIIRDVSTAKVSLLWQQWVFAGIAMASVMIALVRVWLPIFFHACELLGSELSPPGWLDEEGLGAWGKTLGVGIAVFALGAGAGYVMQWIPSHPSDWLPLSFGSALLEYFMIAVTIIVVAVPEGLAMSVTLSLAYSMRRMMKTGTLVRKMNACETIGATTVICSDKTGTLTKNDMRVREVVSPCVNSRTCAEKDGFTCAHADVCKALTVEAISANTTADLEREPGKQPRPIGNATEGALLLWLEGQGIDYLTLRDAFQFERRLPFDTKRKYMATVGISHHDRKRRVHVKGAPEIVLGRCSAILTENGVQALEAGQRSRILASLEEYQRRGFRTLGFAFQEVCADVGQTGIEEQVNDLVWSRFVAIEDPIRGEVPAAIDVCHGAGIEVKMVTGDHPTTAEEVARELVLLKDSAEDGAHITGSEFGQMTDEEASQAVKSLKVLSRAFPEDKERLVRLLRQNGHVVAVTGDGVNDTLAMKHANVALAMGSGTDLAQECSQVVLRNDSFSTIKSAVMWGRALYQNIQRFIVFQLTVNVAALGVAFLGPFIGVHIPLTVIQLLWVNLIMDTFAALALATEPPHEEVMNRPPRNSDAFIVTKEMAKWIFGFGIAFVVLLIGALLFIRRGGVTPHELSVFFAAFVMLQFWNLFNARCFGLAQSALKGFWNNKGFLCITTAIFAGTIAMVQFGGEIFRTEPLTLRDWVLIVGATSVVLWVGELCRLIARRSAPSVKA